MMNKDELLLKSEKFQKYFEEKLGIEPNDLIERASLLSILIAQSGQCLADAKFIQDEIVNGAIMEAIQKFYSDKLSPSTVNKFVTTAAKEANYLVNWLDRINATATHQLEGIRSMLSYRKAEMSMV
jgi:hypothetical protein